MNLIGTTGDRTNRSHRRMHHHRVARRYAKRTKPIRQFMSRKHASILFLLARRLASLLA
jgi:hypothetical protein